MIPVVHTLKLYELVNKYFRNKEDSKAFVSEIDNFMSVKINTDTEIATKSDIRLLKSDINRLETEIMGVKTDLGKLEIKMGEGFKDILKWIITLMVGFASLIIACMKILS